MPRHDVSFEIPRRALDRADARFEVKSDGEVLGTLTVSKGSVVWFPKKTTYGYKVRWEKFDELMRDYANRTERR